MTKSIMPTYARLPVTFAKGQGVWLWDSNGEKYLDALSGIGVCGLGHCHLEISRVIKAQAERLLHTSNLFHIETQQQLADQLIQLSGMTNAFFCNSGAEANEAAIKIARLYGHTRQIEQPAIVVMEHSFHGRTLATLTATGNRKVQAGFEPLVHGFSRAEYNNVEQLENIAKNNPDIVAILVEPVQGEGGINIPDKDYLNKIRALCDRNQWLMMLDEIQTGIARSGKMFAYQHNDILPDVVTLAKALGNGIPVGACLASGVASTLLQAGSHGSTFGGNPFACRVAQGVLSIIESENLTQHVENMSHYIQQLLTQSIAHLPIVKSIRVFGLMIGIELKQSCKSLVAAGLEEHIIINVTADKVIRLLPPLIITEKEADILITALTKIIKNFK